MTKIKISPEEMKKTLREMGYRARTKQCSDFSQVTVYCGDTQINGGLVTPEFREKYKNYFDWRVTVSVVDSDGWRYIL